MPERSPPPEPTPIDWSRFNSLFEDILNAQQKEIGQVNIIIAGDTGVGKSTLVNAVFGEDLAKTGMGTPVTEQAFWYSRTNFPLRILDTRGLETEQFSITLKAIEEEIVRANRSPSASDHVHIAWLCISGALPRVQNSHITLCRLFNKCGVPVVVVITQHGMHPDFPKLVPDLFTKGSPERSGRVEHVIPVRALPFPGSQEIFGLRELVDATFLTLPEAAKNAFARVQIINLDKKRESARKVVLGAATTAAGLGAFPVAADVLTLVPLQIGMIIGISLRFGIEVQKDRFIAFATSVVGCASATFFGRWISGVLLRFIPGLGWAINGAVAASITQALGEAYTLFLYQFVLRTGKLPTLDQIMTEFPDFWNKDPGSRA